MKLEMKAISALEKVFPDEVPAGMPELKSCEGFQNETVSFQVAYSLSGAAQIWIRPNVVSPIAEFIHVRTVRLVPVRLACMPDSDEDFLRKTPGLYPDLLQEIQPNRLHAIWNQWDALWIDAELEGKVDPGTYPVRIEILEESTGECLGGVTVSVTVLPGLLPKQKLIHTKWFHYDALAHYYRVPVFSERFWEITENFMLAAVRRGINMMYMPIHTPPLDTREGGERLTVQLVDVVVENGSYRFGFEKLRRWVDMARRCGVEYFEAAHLFTQWGARATPKIMAAADGEYRRIFGWDVPADSSGYRTFLDAYLPALVAELKRLGIAERTYFHISDEPGEEHLENYLKAKEMVKKHLQGFVIMDALSSIKLYRSGAVEKPVPAINHMDDFLAARIPGLWTYYCMVQDREVSNMFMAMPSYRNRILGAQLYKFDIEGFLHWGYNFYGTQYSDGQMDPYAVTDGNAFSPAGDCFQVYPGEDGRPEESIRMMVTHHALQDLRAMQWLEKLAGREKVLEIIDVGPAEPVTFTRYPREAEYLIRLRERINQEILSAAEKG